MSTADRLTLCLQIDVARLFDSTVTQTQLTNNTFQASMDDRDMLASHIEDAEHEFRQRTDATFRPARAGSPGTRQTYPQITYKPSGHEDYKRDWMGVAGNYDAEMVTRNLPDDRILPFDSAEGDEAYIFRGIGGASGNDWEDVTADFGDTWTIIDHRSGTVAFHPIELARTMQAHAQGIGFRSDQLKRLRFAISYRYGNLGGSRSYAGATALGASINSSDTGSTAVADGSRLPDAGLDGGTVVLKAGEEYLRATVDPGADTIDIVERGIRGTNAASHANGDRVQYTPPSIRKAVASRAAMGLVSSGRYSAFAPESEDALDKDDLMDTFEATWTATVDAMADG